MMERRRLAVVSAAASTLKPWQHSDLRRTARTLMARMGVSSEVAEHCIGHVLTTIQATYNKYGYLKEKREAFAKLAELIGRITAPRSDKVVALRRAEQR